MAKPSRRSAIQRVLLIALSWSLIGTLLFVYAHSFLAAITAGNIPDYYHPLTTWMGFALSSFAGGLVFGYVLVKQSRTARRRSFGREILVTTCWFIGVYVTSIVVPTVLATLSLGEERSLAAIGRNLLATMNGATFVSILVWAIVLGLTQFVLQINTKLGQGVLWNFITGKYFHPREENRIFMFLDLNDSTTIAEKIGHRRFFDLLSMFMADVAEPILENNGRIYSYVGDEVIVYWSPGDRQQNTDPYRCFFAISDRIKREAEKYTDAFDLVPDFKAAIHAGSVTIGEMGLVKKDIVFSGDTLNTTSRILSECRSTGFALLTSAQTVERSECAAAFNTSTLDLLTLRGKQKPIQLVGVERRSESHRVEASPPKD